MYRQSHASRSWTRRLAPARRVRAIVHCELIPRRGEPPVLDHRRRQPRDPPRTLGPGQEDESPEQVLPPRDTHTSSFERCLTSPCRVELLADRYRWPQDRPESARTGPTRG